MKYTLQINQAVIFENEWHKSSDLNTWALFDFLCFFNNAEGHRTLNDGEFKWINYKYIIESLPLCDFYNQKIKKHLDILASFGIIALEKDSSNNIYFKLLPKHRILFEKSYKPREFFTHPLVENYLPPRENFTHNNNKESISKNNNNFESPYNPPKPQSENTIDLKAIKESFERVRELYKTIKSAKSDLYFQLAEQEFFKIVKSGEIDCEGITKAMEQQVELWSILLKNGKTTLQYIPRLERWLSEKSYFQDFDTLLQPYKEAQAKLSRGSQDWGSKDTPNGKLSDLLKM